MAFNKAASQGDVAALERWHWWGANIDELADWDEAAADEPALNRAVDNSQVEAFRWLLDHNSNPNMGYSDSYPLGIAESNARIAGNKGRRAAECAKLLRAYGAVMRNLP